jgi:quinol monooxygenase YgiN
VPVERRAVLAGAAALAATGSGANAGGGEMYGLIGKMLAQPGRRDELIRHMVGGVDAMPGCLSYVVALDPTNPDAIWITGVWASQASHQASLKLPAVQAMIALARPLIAGFGERFETQPVGGFGLPKP